MLTRKDPADAGFTIVEVLVALAVIGVVLTAATTFFVRSMVVINLQGSRQVAIQIASTNLEQLRAMSGEPALNWLLDRTAAGPTPAPDTGGSLSYTQAWTCTDGSGPCVAATLATAMASGPIFLGATVKITWTSLDCAGNQCAYSATTKISVTHYEPVFGTS
jgi:prepilin-type N-terminal cleavage/methylation domain-containing protein